MSIENTVATTQQSYVETIETLQLNRKTNTKSDLFLSRFT